MNYELLERCDEFMQYHAIMKHALGINGTGEECAVGAYYYLITGAFPDTVRIQECRELLRRRSGVFSGFRAHGSDILACMLAADSDPEYRLELTILAHQYLRTEFTDTSYLPILAFFFTEYLREDQFGRYTAKAKQVYGMMRDQHIMLTSYEDVIFSGLFAMSGRDLKQLTDEAEAIYQYLKPAFTFNGNALQTLSHALALCQGGPVDKAERTGYLWRLLQKQRIRFPKSFPIAALGILANSGIEAEVICRDFLKAQEQLKELVHGLFSSKETRYYFTVLVLASYYLINSTEMTAAVIIRMIVLLAASDSA